MSAPALALPGTLCDARVFAPLGAELGVEFTCPDVARFDGAAAAAETLLAEAPPRFWLYAFSLGGFTALQMASLAPERLCGLVLIGCNARPDPPESQARRKAQFATAASSGFRTLIAELWPLYVAEPAARPDLFELIVAMAQSAGLDAFARQTQMASARPDLRPRLGEIDAPVLALRGAVDPLCRPETQAELVEGLPQAQAATVPACGHFALLEDPRGVAAEITAWMAQSAVEA